MSDGLFGRHRRRSAYAEYLATLGEMDGASAEAWANLEREILWDFHLTWGQKLLLVDYLKERRVRERLVTLDATR